MATRVSVPNLLGTLLLVAVFAAMLPVFNTFLNYLAPRLGTVSSFMLTLLIPSIFLAMIANIWEDDTENRGV